jgi:hypothetical protein
MFRRLLIVLVAVLLAFAPGVASAKLTRSTPIQMVGTGSAVQVTSNATIYCYVITFQADPGNAGYAYVGGSTVSSTSYQAALDAGVAYTLKVEGFQAAQGERYQLDDFYVLSTGPDFVCVTYEVIE